MNDDTGVNRKLRAVLLHNMKPILCIGESKSEYDAGLVKSVRHNNLMGDHSLWSWSNERGGGGRGGGGRRRLTLT